MRDQSEPVQSAVLAVYLRQRRINRLRSVRVVARIGTVLALAVLVGAAVIFDRADPSSPLVRLLLGGAMLAWVVALVYDLRGHSHRLDARMLQMQSLALRDRVEGTHEADRARRPVRPEDRYLVSARGTTS